MTPQANRNNQTLYDIKTDCRDCACKCIPALKIIGHLDYEKDIAADMLGILFRICTEGER